MSEYFQKTKKNKEIILISFFIKKNIKLKKHSYYLKFNKKTFFIEIVIKQDFFTINKEKSAVKGKY